jgi:hypothetical protein
MKLEYLSVTKYAYIGFHYLHSCCIGIKHILDCINLHSCCYWNYAYIGLHYLHSCCIGIMHILDCIIYTVVVLELYKKKIVIFIVI